MVHNKLIIILKTIHIATKKCACERWAMAYVCMNISVVCTYTYFSHCLLTITNIVDFSKLKFYQRITHENEKKNKPNKQRASN